MENSINLAEKLALLDGPFQPGIVGFMNDYKLAVVKVSGEFVWHKHEDTDDFFLVLSGRLTIQLRDRDVELSEGELFVVPRGRRALPAGGGGGARAADRAARDGQHRRRRRRADRARTGHLSAATSCHVRPERTLSGCSATTSEPRRALSSTVLTRIHCRSPVLVRAKPPWSFWPRRVTTR